jgi:hypothetical protein
VAKNNLKEQDQIMKETINTFCNWLKAREYQIHPWTNEKTIQNQLGLFLNFWLPQNIMVELEVNVLKLPGITGPMQKKEADIVIRKGQNLSAIEVKFWRDPGTYNIGMFRCYEDVAFLEQLKAQGFSRSAVLFLTDIPQHYTKPDDIPTARNPENQKLHNTFRCNQELHGTVQIKTGALNESVSIEGTYPLIWRQLLGNTYFCVIEV